jgi:hypothetical protein
VHALLNTIVALPAPLVTVAPIAIPVPTTYQPVIADEVLAVRVTDATPAPPPDEKLPEIAVLGPHGEKIITPLGVLDIVADKTKVVVPAPLATVVPGMIFVPETYHPLILEGVFLVNVKDVVLALDKLSLKSLLASERLLVDSAVRRAYVPEPAAEGV